MALAPSGYPSLCSSPPLPRATQSLFSSTKHHFVLNNNCSIFSTCFVSNFCSGKEVVKRSDLVVKASETESQEMEISSDQELYEVEIEQPYGLKFRKGRGGGTYIDAILPGGTADKTGLFTVGDKVLATSAVFGTEIWPAAEYGRTMYTIRQRIGPLLMKLQKRYGKVDDEGELTEKEIIRAERNSGVISNKVREIQMQNYLRKKEQKQQREMDLREGLQLYRFKLGCQHLKIPWRQDLRTLRESGQILIWPT
ncbi:hypothetical protein PTKIN_Ptkin03bG0119700 [Pterospermum kingtungense]